MKTLSFILLFYTIIILTTGCEKEETSLSVEGKVIGYIKSAETTGCAGTTLHDGNKTGNTLFGLYIVTESKDSLLSFNIEPSLFNLDIESLQSGIWATDYSGLIDNPQISFTYRKAKDNEFQCCEAPLVWMVGSTFSYPTEHFTQIIISNISKIQ